MPAQSPVLFFEYKLAYSVGTVTLPWTVQFPLFFFQTTKRTYSMAMRKIGVGTLVSVEQESTGRGRRRPSEGGITTQNNTTQQSTTTMKQRNNNNRHNNETTTTTQQPQHNNHNTTTTQQRKNNNNHNTRTTPTQQ